MTMLNSPLPPDVDVTQRLQTVISEWKGAQAGHKLERLYLDCVDLVGQDKQLLPLRIIPVRELDSVSLERALRHYRFSLDYSVDIVGRFEAALVPVVRESGQAVGFLFAFEEELRVQDQVALFAHAVGHLLINHQQRLAERALDLDPDEGQTHTDRLAELRYLDISENRNLLDRKVLESFPTLTKLIELPEESQAAQHQALRELNPILRRQGWVNQYVSTPYRYTRGRVIPNSTLRGKRLTIDVLLRAWASLPTAVVHVQRPHERLEEAVRRVRSAAQQLRVPFAYIFTHQKDFVELNWLSGSLSDPQVRATLPTREELQTRWVAALQLSDQEEQEALAYPYQPDQTPRYYQEAAINQAVIATLLARRGLRDNRILLTLATGTGKTQIAFQILWKLKKTYQVRNVLFLADRGYLLDQAQTNTFGPFRDAIKRGMGEGDTAHDILFGTYQWLTNIQDGEERYKSYPPDYFDVIVIDECHRGSAVENSNWRKVLEHFSPAIQIGLTATPLETGDVQTKSYFGPSVYTYTLSQGINDGYLAPYSVRRVQIGKASQGMQSTLMREPEQTLDQQIVMQTGNTMRQYTQTIAEHLALYLRRQADPRAQKTIVFCVDNEHADDMRIALQEACADWARMGDIVRIVDDDGPEGKRALNLFCTVRERHPVIVTTARLLTTGVDVPTCKNIVLARGVGSIVEFKQIIGRGTRISEPGKTWFTILDYAGAIKHFFDPDFDGEPTSIQREYVLPTPMPSTIGDETGELAVSPVAGDDSQKQGETQQNEQGEEQARQAEIELTPTEPLEIVADEDWGSAGEDHPHANQSSKVIENSVDYSGCTQQGPYASAEVAHRESSPVEDRRARTEVVDGVAEETGQSDADGPKRDAATEMEAAPIVLGKPAPPHPRIKAERAGAQQLPTQEQPVIVGKESGRRFVIIGEYFYELDATGTRLREGKNSDFAQEVLKDMLKTPEELRTYWSDKQARRLLIDELKDKFVALDALAKALDLPDVDHFDLLRQVLFQQPTLSREERVRRLRSEHSTFFQRFEHNLLAKELLNVILDKYSRGEAPDVSDLDLLGVQPLKIRTQKEWLQAFSQGPTRENLPAVLKELQQLLYSV